MIFKRKIKDDEGIMAILLKNCINQKFLDELADVLSDSDGPFERKVFKSFVSQKVLNPLELKERWTAVAVALCESLPSDYSLALKQLQKIAPKFNGLKALCFPAFVEIYGPHHPKKLEDSLRALEIFTQFSTAEFAIRHLYKINPQKVQGQMKRWSKHSNYHLRRLASEGMRPKLPWAIKINDFILDPLPNLEILENLKEDSELYVRKSVANHLNDLGKDHPDLLICVAKKWWGKSLDTNWIIKHALRNLLKAQNQEALKIVGIKKIPLKAQLKLMQKKIKLNETLEYSVQLNIKSKSLIRIDLILYFVRKKSGYGKKVFKILEKEISKDIIIHKKLSLKKMTTRQYYPGIHRLEIVVNGKTQDCQKFEIIK